LSCSVVTISVGIVIVVGEMACDLLKLSSTDWLRLIGDNPSDNLGARRGSKGARVRPDCILFKALDQCLERERSDRGILRTKVKGSKECIIFVTSFSNIEENGKHSQV